MKFWIAAFLIPCVSSANILKKPFQKFATAVCLSSLSFGFNPIDLVNADSGLATVVETSRNFDDLPTATKKRRALALCKEEDKRSNAGFSSIGDCNAAVLQGDFAVALSTNPTTTTNLKLTAIEKTTKPAAIGEKLAEKVLSSSLSSSSSEKKEKSLDLSDLPGPARKRRALAACKKAEVRKFARAGSESKCTASVMDGEIAPIIEALEYGL
jgi:hypothetical protein